MTTKLPKELYVVYQDPRDPQNPPLGFLNGYEPGKAAFEKKRVTQESWAFAQYKINPKLVMQANGLYILEYDEIVSTDWNKHYKDPSRHTYRKMQEPIKTQPEIWQNDALPGFMILHSVSRYSTSNKVWRILDPRGIVFEVPTSMMNTIIKDAGIKKGGEIDAKCCWAGNKALVLS